MSVDIKAVVASLNLRRTVLLFGAGASVPSGGPPTSKVIEKIAREFDIKGNYTLGEIAGIAEQKADRAKLIRCVRGLIQNLKPTAGMRNIPLFPWKSIFTTNYDQLVEEAYRFHGKACRTYSSNFDFTIEEEDPDVELFKLHGTIEKDAFEGNASRMIITDSDYDLTEQYRQYLYDRLKADLAGAQLVIIGQSLADPDMRALINRAADLNHKAMQKARITLLMYEHDENRAGLFQARNIDVAFGSIDDFSAALTELQHSSSTPVAPALRPLTALDKVRGSTIEVADVSEARRANLSMMSSGWPATYADITAGYTFERGIVREMLAYFEEHGSLVATVLGAAGVGKSTAIRQLLAKINEGAIAAYEHKVDHGLSAAHWREIATGLKSEGRSGILFVDDAHHHLQQLNMLIDWLIADDNVNLKIVVASSRNHWDPRNKTPNVFKHGRAFRLRRLTNDEIDRLLVLVDQNAEVRAMVERDFAGFSREERRRRLVTRCENDMFVCLKNIFGVEAFDDIILRDYAELDTDYQDVFRYVAAMENAGVRVHRQLVIRLLGVQADSVAGTLRHLRDIVMEYDVDDRNHIYAWRCRHPVISEIISRYKFADTKHVIDLFDRVIDNISPTYDIEIRTIRELCNLANGLSRIPNREEQNRLLRKMISVAPGERVPRHRLIRNLIEENAFEKAETEIRLFHHDFGPEGPVHRYRVRLLIARAVRSKGLMDEDRLVILKEAEALAVAGVERYPNNKSLLAAYADVGIEYYKRTKSYEIYDAALEELKRAEDRVGDPDISNIIRRCQNRIAGHWIEQEDAVDQVEA